MPLVQTISRMAVEALYRQTQNIMPLRGSVLRSVVRTGVLVFLRVCYESTLMRPARHAEEVAMTSDGRPNLQG
jgi:hypothetical protein